MLNFHTLDNTTLDAYNQSEYMRFRYDLILAGEAIRDTVYLDTNKNKLPTIGIGFNLTDDNILELVLNAFGIDTSSPSSTALNDFKIIITNAVENGTNPQVGLDAKRIKGVSITLHFEQPCHVAHALN